MGEINQESFYSCGKQGKRNSLEGFQFSSLWKRMKCYYQGFPIADGSDLDQLDSKTF